MTANGPTTLRIAIVSYESLQSRIIVQAILAAFPHAVVGILASETAVPGKSAAAAVWFFLRRTGLGFVARKGVEIWLSRLAAWRDGGRRDARVLPSLAAMAARMDVPFAGADDVNGAAARATLAAWRPDLLVSVNCNQRLARSTMGLATRGAVNVHGAPLPRYRGLFPYFWMLADGETEAGVTVHWMDERFDTGDVLLQERFAIAADDTVFSLSLKGAHVGAALMTRAIAAIADGSAVARPQDESASSYRSWPTRADVARLRRRGRRYGSLGEMWRAFRG